MVRAARALSLAVRGQEGRRESRRVRGRRGGVRGGLRLDERLVGVVGERRRQAGGGRRRLLRAEKEILSL